MNRTNQGSIIVGIILIALGALFFIANTIPGLDLGTTWPAIFFLLAGAFYLPLILYPNERRGLAALYIPGSILLVLGLIFFYNTLSGDWDAWAYMWALIPGGVGLGLALAARLGDWGMSALWTGIWLMIGSLAAFGLFGSLFGSDVVRVLGPVLLIAGGALLLLRTVQRPSRET
jgi:hypothetical protein